MKKAIVTVVGHDRVGIIARVATLLAEYGVNVLDISQTVMREYFSMIMLVELDGLKTDFAAFAEEFRKIGEAAGVDIRVMHEDIFNSMHRI